MFSDFKDLVALLNKHRAKYLIAGGYAVSRHAQPRVTKDLDILIQPTPTNAAAVFRALRELGDTGAWYTMGVPPVAIDIPPAIPGIGLARPECLATGSRPGGHVVLRAIMDVVVLAACRHGRDADQRARQVAAASALRGVACRGLSVDALGHQA